MTRRSTRILLTGSAAIATALTACSTQSTPEWFRLLDGPGHSALFGMAQGANGNTLVVGATNHRHMPPYSGDALLLETDRDGAVVWERTWGGPQFEQASAVLPSDRGYFVFGETDSYGAGDRDFFLLEISEVGDEVWFRTYGTAEREWPYGMIRLATGDLFLFGMTRYSSGGECPFAVRVSTAGDVIWEYAPVCSDDEIILDALETDGGNIVLALTIGRNGGLRALDQAGTVLWSRVRSTTASCSVCRTIS
jgi:hypothetical protein